MPRAFFVPILIVISITFVFCALMVFSGRYQWRVQAPDSVHSRAIGGNLEYIQIPSVITNLSGRSGRYCKAGFTLETEKNKAASMQTRESISFMQDSISGIVSAYSYNSLKTHEGKIRLKRHVRSALNSKLSQQEIYDVYFREFLLQ